MPSAREERLHSAGNFFTIWNRRGAFALLRQRQPLCCERLVLQLFSIDAPARQHSGSCAMHAQKSVSDAGAGLWGSLPTKTPICFDDICKLGQLARYVAASLPC